ncbi:MAG: ABC transporter permease [Actinobacteria bacterium]|uniref:Unannotated protein n=1 Tax=freshwater metagenome TaxID=449393 RepID=A0A6J7HRI1_9ZZZZ|nr:ABC transporter permease [Actinomycetota bacterium]MTA76919.1 ABC transporter permease [Actinomycetota bacterium]
MTDFNPDDERPDVPPPELRYRRRVGLRSAASQLWAARGMVESSAQRALRSRYQRNLLGPLWVLISPIAYLLVFTTFLRRVVQIDTGGVPYPLFIYTAMVPWQFFTAALNNGSTSIVSNLALIRKFRAPSEVYPIAMVVVAAIDAVVVALVLPVFFIFSGKWPTLTILWIPLILLIELVVIMAPVLLLSALMPYLRDLRQFVPLALQIGFLCTPIAYSVDSIPKGSRVWLSIVNPMIPVVDSFRRCLVYGRSPDWGLLGVGLLSASALFVVGYFAFRRLEVGFADVA